MTLHQKECRSSPLQGVVGKILPTAFRKGRVVVEPCLVRRSPLQKRKVGPGGVLSCVTYGSRVGGQKDPGLATSPPSRPSLSLPLNTSSRVTGRDTPLLDAPAYGRVSACRY